MAKVKSYPSVMDDRDWRAEADCNTLMAAEAIKSDKKRHQAAREYAKQKLMNIAKVAGEEGDH